MEISKLVVYSRKLKSRKKIQIRKVILNKEYKNCKKSHNLKINPLLNNYIKIKVEYFLND